MARTKKEEAPEYDWDSWEYVTYAPGHKCSAHMRTVKPLEVVVRGVIERASGVPAVVYRHDKCPKNEASAADIRAWCKACGAEDQTDDLIAANIQADQMYVHWQKLHRHGMRRAQEEVGPLYEQTRHFRVYCSNVVPGMLQTEAYAAALLSTIAAFQGTPDDSQTAAASRIERSRVLHDGNRRFALLLEETVLRYRIGDAPAMAGQLGYLLAVMALPNVSLGVIPFTAQRLVWPLEAFYLFDGRQASVEILTAAVNVTAPSEVATYARAFSELSKLAVYGAPARALISNAITSLG